MRSKSSSVDIALIDFNMPGLDGLELVARIRESAPEMPIAVVSANLQDEIIVRTRELKAAFIPKPLTDEALALSCLARRCACGKRSDER